MRDDLEIWRRWKFRTAGKAEGQGSVLDGERVLREKSLEGEMFLGGLGNWEVYW